MSQSQVEREPMPDAATNPAVFLDLYAGTRVVLPPGFEHTSLPDPLDVAILTKFHYPIEYLSVQAADFTLRGQRKDGGIIETGVVETATGRLVGYGSVHVEESRVGDLIGNLANFVVHKSYRGRNIGRFVVDDRIYNADSQGVESLWLEGLAVSNTLKHYYVERGFRKTRQDRIARGPDPALYFDQV